MEQDKQNILWAAKVTRRTTIGIGFARSMETKKGQLKSKKTWTTTGSYTETRKWSDGIKKSAARQIRQRLEKSEWSLQEEAESHSQIERETSGGTGEILRSNEANKEEKERAEEKEEEETKSRHISTSIRKHHKDCQRAMAWAQYGSPQTSPGTKTNHKDNRSKKNSHRVILPSIIDYATQHDLKYFAKPLEEMLEQSAPRMLAWARRGK